MFNLIAVVVAAFVPLLIGFVWYHPKVFGTAWMQAAGITEEKLKDTNMVALFGVSFLLSVLFASFIPSIVIHQFGAYSMVGGDVETALPSYGAFMYDYGEAFRTFRHGLLHGTIAGVLFVFPIIAINALFERKSWKYILIHAGYWALTLALMGGIICTWQ